MKRWLLLFFGLGGGACTTDHAPPPELTVGADPLCTESAAATCINAGTSTHVVSGLHVIHKRIPGEAVVALRVLIDGGDRSGRQLWSEATALDLLEQEGSTDLGLTAWPAALEKIGARVTAGMGTGYGSVSAVAPVSSWDALWSLVVSSLASPPDDEYVLSYLREQTKHAYATELDEPGNAARVTALAALLAGQPYERFRDTQDEVSTLTPADIHAAWKGMLTKERVWIVVAGDIAWPDLAAKVEAAFAGLPTRRASSFEPPPPPAPRPTAPQTTVLDFPDAPNWQIAGYFIGPDASAPDYPAFAVATATLSQRLFAEVREARGLAYSVSAAAGFGVPSIGVLAFATASPDEAFPVVGKTIADLIAGPIDAAELAAAQGLITAGLLSNNRTPSAIAGTLGSYQLTLGDRTAVEDYVAAVSGVGEEQARQALARYLRSASLAAAGPGGAVSEAALLGILPGSTPDGGL